MEGRGHLHVLPPVLLHCVSTFPFRPKGLKNQNLDL